MIHAFKTTLAAAVLVASALFSPALAQDAELPEVMDMTLGQPEAPVKIVEYASFTCPHCADFHNGAFKQLQTEYIDTGKVHFTLREVYFDRYGLWAAMMARCGGEMRYFPIVTTLYETQRDWAGSDDPNVVVANLRRMAIAAGMDGAAVDACMKDGPMAQALVNRFETNMKADDVQGTPTFFINGVKHSNMAYADLKALIETELAK
jgi:protein-disulfide isomerase